MVPYRQHCHEDSVCGRGDVIEPGRLVAWRPVRAHGNEPGDAWRGRGAACAESARVVRIDAADALIHLTRKGRALVLRLRVDQR